MFEYEGRQYIERESVKAETLADYRARIALGQNPRDAIEEAYAKGLEKDILLDKEEFGA